MFIIQRIDKKILGFNFDDLTALKGDYDKLRVKLPVKSGIKSEDLEEKINDLLKD